MKFTITYTDANRTPSSRRVVQTWDVKQKQYAHDYAKNMRQIPGFSNVRVVPVARATGVALSVD